MGHFWTLKMTKKWHIFGHFWTPKTAPKMWFLSSLDPLKKKMSKNCQIFDNFCQIFDNFCQIFFFGDIFRPFFSPKISCFSAQNLHFYFPKNWSKICCTQCAQIVKNVSKKMSKFDHFWPLCTPPVLIRKTHIFAPIFDPVHTVYILTIFCIFLSFFCHFFVNLFFSWNFFSPRSTDENWEILSCFLSCFFFEKLSKNWQKFDIFCQKGTLFFTLCTRLFQRQKWYFSTNFSHFFVLCKKIFSIFIFF